MKKSESEKAPVGRIRSNKLLYLHYWNAIADKEWYTARANQELAQYGEWRSDWNEPIKEVNKIMKKILDMLEAYSSA